MVTAPDNVPCTPRQLESQRSHFCRARSPANVWEPFATAVRVQAALPSLEQGGHHTTRTV